MNDQIKPIKRSPSLIPLSREHHEVLLLAWKIREGLRKEIDIDRITKYIHWFFAHYMENHFTQEEVEFARIIDISNPLYQKMIKDHNDIRRMLRDLNEYTSTSQLQDFADLTTEHVRFEERQLFNLIEKVATTDQLDLLNKNLVPHQNEEYTDIFWLKGAYQVST